MFDFWKDYMSDQCLTLVKHHNNAESYFIWYRNWGAHRPPMKLRNAGSTNPMEPAQKKFNGKKANGASRGPERPHRGGSSYVQLSAKIEKINSPTRKWNALSVQRSVSATTAAATVTIPVHPKDDLMGNTRNVCKRHHCNEQKIVY